MKENRLKLRQYIQNNAVFPHVLLHHFTFQILLFLNVNGTDLCFEEGL